MRTYDRSSDIAGKSLRLWQLKTKFRVTCNFELRLYTALEQSLIELLLYTDLALTMVSARGVRSYSTQRQYLNLGSGFMSHYVA
ncbi:hypothetical protein XELAEV_18006171mg [Xenopus laevis]|uniref:Uncharacterized protein n=1 Tax=Xenopus laevis TaxID=8355 RepID=A0A974I442_XENLA|nr:hypothetical protein XELAEV_18006171mg [Xenopus laevis]